MSKFKRGQAKLQRKGYSKKSAAKIMAVRGARKYGWGGMARKAAAARRRNMHRKGRR